MLTGERPMTHELPSHELPSHKLPAHKLPGWTLLTLLFWALGSPVLAQQTPSPISGQISVAAPVELARIDDDDPPPIRENRQINGEAIAVLFADYTHADTVNGIAVTSNYIASAQVFGGLRPQAQVQVASTASSADPQFALLSERSSATAEVNYEVVIAQRAEPPIVFHPPLRLFVDVRAEVQYLGADENGAATATVRVSNPARNRFFQRQIQLRLNATGGESESARWGFTARPGDPIRVHLRARAESKTRGETMTEPAILQSDGLAIADPFFDFDQAAFDQDMAAAGLTTFDLRDYFEITYSPNLLEGTPRLFGDGFE